MGQKDYDKGVNISKKGNVKVGDIDINGGNGTVKTGSVDINGGGVNVDTKKLMAGVQYVGEKVGGKKMEDANEASEEVEIKKEPTREVKKIIKKEPKKVKSKTVQVN